MEFFDINSLTGEEKFALFYGVMLGDGCLSYYTQKRESGRLREFFSVCITGNIDDAPFYTSVVIPIFKLLINRNVKLKYRKSCSAIDLLISNKKLFDKIQSYGFPVGKKGSNISIPDYFYECNLTRFVVAGFMATDGSLVLTKNPNKYYPRIEGNGISKKLIQQIKEYLSNADLKGSFYLAKRKSRFYPNWQQQYRFQFNGKDNLMTFNEKIGFVNPKHQKKFEDFLSYNERYDRKIKGTASQEQRFIRIKGFSGWRGS